MEKANYTNDPIAALLDVMEIMRRSDKPCYWTKEQTWDSLVRHTIEEAYEVADAVERNCIDDVKAEVADLLNQVIFYAQIAKENSYFDFYDVVSYLTDKLVKRHPNVFSDKAEKDIKVLEKNWEAIKERERKLKGSSSILDGIVKNMPALSVANKLQHRVSKVGFDWTSKEKVFEQLKSEVVELEQALQTKNNDAVLDEVGDVLFGCVNLIRHLNKDPEQVMRHANNKFERRFRYIESQLVGEGISLNEASLNQMEAYWHKAKESE